MSGGQGAVDTLPGRMRTTAAMLAPARVTAMTRSFDAWRILPSGRAQPLPSTGDTLVDVLASAQIGCAHKDSLVIRDLDPVREEAKVHVYVIKQQAKGRWVYRDHVTSKVHDLYPVHLFSMDVSAFAPVEPWRWTPGCDASGYAIAGVVEGARA